jgi:hypothetical protein
MKKSGLRGRGGAGFPTGLKWSFMPKQQRRPAALPRRQCRRVGARHLQGSRDHAQRPAYAGRRLPDRLLRDGRATPAYIYIRGEYVREREALQRAVDEAYEANLIGKNNKSTAIRLISMCITAPAPISAARRRRCSRASRARRACRGSSRRSRPMWASMAARPRSTTSSRSRSRRPSCAAARLVLLARQAQQCRHQAVLRLRPCEQAVQRRGGDGPNLPRADRPPLRRHPRRLGQSEGGHPRRLVGAAWCRPSRSSIRRWISTRSPS